MIAEGFRQMTLAMTGERLTAYHLEAGLQLLEPLRAQTIVQNHLPFHLALGDLELRRGQRDHARAAFTAALGLAMSEQERKLIAGKLQQAADA
jgi:predicted RNA polymerase sigma factor